jgi:hypothetical protein
MSSLSLKNSFFPEYLIVRQRCYNLIVPYYGCDFMNSEHVAGNDKGKIMLYALSTCIWCKKTRELLQSSGAAFDYVYVDLLKGEDRAQAIEEIKPS